MANVNDVLTANYMKIYIDDKLVGGFKDVVLHFNGEKLVYNAIGGPTPISTNLGRARVDFTATIGLIDDSIYKKVMGQYKSDGGTEYKSLMDGDGTTLDKYNSSDFFKDVRFTIKGRATRADGTLKDVVVRNLVLTNYRLSIREGEYVLQDIEGVATMMYYITPQ